MSNDMSGNEEIIKAIDDVGEGLTLHEWIELLYSIVDYCEMRIEAARDRLRGQGEEA